VGEHNNYFHGAASPAHAPEDACMRLEDQLGWYDTKTASHRVAQLRSWAAQVDCAGTAPVVAGIQASAEENCGAAIDHYCPEMFGRFLVAHKETASQEII
jgi:hypothetical protein